jgi:T-complex protein 1 subunit gamma
MLKMILDPMGGIVMTNDGHAILREVDVTHPAAKSMIELSRTQDEEVGDGTTSVIILAGELMVAAQPFLVKNMHPRIIVAAYMSALEEAMRVVEAHSIKLDTTDKTQVMKLVRSCLGTKFVAQFGDLVCNLAVDAVARITLDRPDGSKEIDIKRYARVEKIPGDMLEASMVLDGVMLNKDVVMPTMKRRIVNPRILLLDSTLEYKKMESQANVEVTNEDDWNELLKQEEDWIEKQCNAIIAAKPDIVMTEKGVADLAGHFLSKAGIAVLRRLRKTDNNRVARACGATIVSDPMEIKESDIGTGCGLFEVRKIADEYFSYFVECKDPKACTILLRGGSKEVLNEIERNLQDAMGVVRNIFVDPRIVPGGGAIEMAVSTALVAKSKSIDNVQQWPYRGLASAFEVIPKTLLDNCGASTIRVLTALRAKHNEGNNHTWGIDGSKGELADMKDLGIFEPFLVKSQTIKTAIER